MKITSASWGMYPYQRQSVHEFSWISDIEPKLTRLAETCEQGYLPYGLGRSYGDSCLATGGQLLGMSKLNRFISFDRSTGILRAEAGVTLQQITSCCLPQGWFLPVTPGTQFVTLGGAVANDVHGKNHHVRGTFCHHVKGLGLYRSDLGYVECYNNSDPHGLLPVTFSGLGLSGIILWVEIQLMPVTSVNIDSHTIKFSNIDEFFNLSDQYDHQHEYSVAWIDCQAKGGQLGRGLFTYGDHSEGSLLSRERLQLKSGVKLKVPITPPVSLVNSLTLKLFNELYYHRQRQRQVFNCTYFESFFYPLDAIENWNRIYGRKGFQQYQCVIPEIDAAAVMKDILKEVTNSGNGSFLAVMKRCGEKESPGLLSFPMKGLSLALDFPQREQSLRQLFLKLDKLVAEAKGRLYPAKDAHMSAEFFQASYPQWQKIEQRRDPVLKSSFWSRVSQ